MSARAELTRAGVVPSVATHARPLEIGAFVAVAFGASWGLAALGPSPLLLALALWVPGLAALALTALGGRGTIARLGLDRLGWPDAYLIAIWLPLVMAVGVTLLAAAAGVAEIDERLGGVLASPGADAAADGADLTVQQLVAALTIAPFVNMLVTLGSEIGWRAYLLPRLRSIGLWRSILVVAALWSAWQLPLAAAPLGERSPIDVAVQLAWSLLVGAILGWLFVRTGSPWAPALFAGALAATSALPLLFLRDPAPAVVGPTVPFGLVVPALAVLVMWMVPRRTRKG